jgi:hypothetical protein
MNSVHTLTPHFFKTHSLTPWSKILLEKLIVTQSKISFILWHPQVHCCVHKSPPPPTGPYPEPNASSPYFPHPISLRSFLILSSHLCLGHLSELFLSGFLTKILYAFLVSPVYATCATHLIPLDLITLMIFSEAYKLIRLLIMQSSPPSCHFLY